MTACSSEKETSGSLEGAAHRPAEDVARHDVDHGQQHHGEQNRGGGDPEQRVGARPGRRRGGRRRPG